jgi:hypothetical protein
MNTCLLCACAAAAAVDSPATESVTVAVELAGTPGDALLGAPFVVLPAVLPPAPAVPVPLSRSVSEVEVEAGMTVVQGAASVGAEGAGGSGESDAGVVDEDFLLALRLQVLQHTPRRAALSAVARLVWEGCWEGMGGV